MSGALKGLPVTLGARAYVMPAINAVTSKQYWERIQAMQRGQEPDPLGLVSALVLACLQRNYPEMTEADVDPHVDVENLDELSAKCFGAGAFRRWCELQAALLEKGGNVAAPQTPEGDGTGARSTPPSPPSPAGDTETLTN